MTDSKLKSNTVSTVAARLAAIQSRFPSSNPAPLSLTSQGDIRCLDAGWTALVGRLTMSLDAVVSNASPNCALIMSSYGNFWVPGPAVRHGRESIALALLVASLTRLQLLDQLSS